MKLRIIVASIAALVTWLPLHAAEPEHGRHLVRELRRARPRRPISSRVSPRSTTSSIRWQRGRFSARRLPIRDFALAYWGEAMSYNHAVWHEQDPVAARAALAKLGATPEARAAKAKTPREKAYLDAVEILFGDRRRRAIAIGAMRSRWNSCTRSIPTTSTRPASTRSLSWARRTPVAMCRLTCVPRHSWKKCSSATRSILGLLII